MLSRAFSYTHEEEDDGIIERIDIWKTSGLAFKVTFWLGFNFLVFIIKYGKRGNYLDSSVKIFKINK